MHTCVQCCCFSLCDGPASSPSLCRFLFSFSFSADRSNRPFFAAGQPHRPDRQTKTTRRHHSAAAHCTRCQRTRGLCRCESLHHRSTTQWSASAGARPRPTGSPRRLRLAEPRAPPHADHVERRRICAARHDSAAGLDIRIDQSALPWRRLRLPRATRRPPLSDRSGRRRRRVPTADPSARPSRPAVRCSTPSGLVSSSICAGM